ncbi:MAG TPA: hypothetical protein VJR95_12715 [Rhodanobacter sp.]|nr:hypothetical protein [Rhodanobacter sp.]
MPSLYPEAEALARLYRERPSEWLRQQLASGALTWAATSAAMDELQRRGEAPPQPSLRGSSDDDGPDRDGMDATPISEEVEDAPQAKGAWPRWSWFVVPVLAFAATASQGTAANGPENQGFLWLVIALQTLVLSLVVAVVASMTGTRSALGVVGRTVLLVFLAMLMLGLWMLAYVARHGLGA